MRFCQQAPCSWKCHSLKLCFSLEQFYFETSSLLLPFISGSLTFHRNVASYKWLRLTCSRFAAGDKTKNTCKSRDLTFLSLCLYGFSPNMLLLEFLHEFTSQLLYKDEHVHTHMFLISVCRCLSASSPATQCFLSLYLSLHTLFRQPAEVS